MRPLSGKETKELVERVPEILTDILGAAALQDIIDNFKKMDTTYLKDNLGIKELENSFIQRSFPNAHFYKVLRLDEKPPYPYLMATSDNKRYEMPSHFNRLLLDSGLEVNDKNIIELAKALVVLASKEGYGRSRVEILGSLAQTSTEKKLMNNTVFPKLPSWKGRG